jgi:23S rRNA pseudouridine2605 synthase
MTGTESIRLQKYLADSGVCSRRAAEVLIASGQVWVNGQQAAIGSRVVPGVDKVTASGKPVRQVRQEKVTLAMHKPRGLVCTNSDPYHQETVFSVLPRVFSGQRFFCAGRLDKESEGLLILTTDGDLAHRLMHPSSGVVKRYFVELKQPYPASRLAALIRGVVFEGERLRVEHASLIHPRADGSSNRLDVHLHHGRKREIRQLFFALGHDVKRLRRYQIGEFKLKGIPLRAVKPLSKKEISLLFRAGPGPRATPAANNPSPEYP